jgi:very-short-patch-repair endonuclease
MRERRVLPYQRSLKLRARSLRVDATAAERMLWFRFLRHLPMKFTRQKPLDNYIVDFYCSSAQLVIELDGDSHFTSAAEDYDSRRSSVLGALGLRVLRFTNTEVLEQFAAVCERIDAALAEKT